MGVLPLLFLLHQGRKSPSSASICRRNTALTSGTLSSTAAHGGGVCRVHQSNPMASGCPSFVADISSDTCITACVATTTICVTACSVTGLLRTTTPGALLPLPEAARALPGLISCCSDELMYIAEVPYLLNDTSTRMQQLG
ncbi:hypothetical protein ACQJBY_026343 [Aegilops geniculata]